MKKPTELEVKMQFEYKGCTDQTQYKKFLAYYYSVGWYIGKSKMRSWKAAVAGWVLRIETKEVKPSTRMQSSFKPTKE